MAHSDSIRQLIQDAKDKPRAEIAKEVWNALTLEVQDRLGRAQLRRMIAAELNDPDQLEFMIDGEPYPLEEVPPEMLLLRGRSLIKAGKESIKRGEAYIAEGKARLETLKGIGA